MLFGPKASWSLRYQRNSVVHPLVGSGLWSSGLLLTKSTRGLLSQRDVTVKLGGATLPNPFARRNWAPRKRDSPSPLLPSSAPLNKLVGSNQPFWSEAMNISVISETIKYRRKTVWPPGPKPAGL